MPPTTEDVLSALRGVVDPELGGNIVDLGMVADVRIDRGIVTVGIALTIAECPMRSQIEGDTARRVKAMDGVTDVVIETTAMTKRQRAELMSVARRRARDNAEPTQVSPTTRVIAVSSGKGGVGKSSASVNLALAIAAAGFRVGVLDADIWGFSIPRMLGATGRMEADSQTRLIEPVEAHGVKLVSTGLIIETEETALMWRGLMLSKALEQFLKQVAWGELDYLVIDMPPGTGDIQMALTRLLPQAEMVVVTTPQKAAQKVAVRVADMARRSHMPVVGVLENMSDFTCEHGTSYRLFGSGGGDELAEALNIPLIGRIPLDPAVVAGGDEGRPITVHDPENPAAKAFHEAAARLLELVPPAALETCTGRIAKLIESLETGEPLPA
ncbi:MAG TPA: Mrp/NBP35 family ATP-binding protein [Acidimicrobiia bacterium]|nr:Mrp/NBP35 family ATP-binding protein [Acidimicrobiia bacterium]